MALLGVNIDHVATLRQARYRGLGHGPLVGDEPDPVFAVQQAELGGADVITVHLREDRRHIDDRDVQIIAQVVRTRLNLEMAATDEMVQIAVGVKAASAALVPEGRHEVTTEGGLDVAGQRADLARKVGRLREAGIRVSAFIDADERQVEAAAEAGFHICELHTGPFARAFAQAGGDAKHPELAREWERLTRAGARVRARGMRLNAGHALNYANARMMAGLEGIEELHIGHAIVSRAVFVGLQDAVRQMRTLIG